MILRAAKRLSAFAAFLGLMFGLAAGAAAQETPLLLEPAVPSFASTSAALETASTSPENVSLTEVLVASPAQLIVELKSYVFELDGTEAVASEKLVSALISDLDAAHWAISKSDELSETPTWLPGIRAVQLAALRQIALFNLGAFEFKVGTQEGKEIPSAETVGQLREQADVIIALLRK